MHISGQRPITQTPGLQPWSKKSAPSKAQQPIDKTYNGLLVCPGENLTTLSLVEKSPPPKREVFSLDFDSPPTPNSVPLDLNGAWERRGGSELSNSLANLMSGTGLSTRGGSLYSRVKEGELQNLDFDLRFQCDESGKEAGCMSRSINFSDREAPYVEHCYFRLEKEFQKGGIGKSILSNSVKMYDKLGIGKVYLSAGLSVGGYAWAKYGFKPENRDDLFRLYDEVRSNMYSLNLNPRIYSLVTGLLNCDDPKTVWTLSDLQMPVTKFDGEQTTLGKALLMGTSWNGELDLKDRESRERFEQYVGSNQQDGEVKA